MTSPFTTAAGFSWLTGACPNAAFTPIIKVPAIIDHNPWHTFMSTSLSKLESDSGYSVPRGEMGEQLLQMTLAALRSLSIAKTKLQVTFHDLPPIRENFLLQCLISSSK